jgi:hypothetical protein
VNHLGISFHPGPAEAGHYGCRAFKNLHVVPGFNQAYVVPGFSRA